MAKKRTEEVHVMPKGLWWACELCKEEPYQFFLQNRGIVVCPDCYKKATDRSISDFSMDMEYYRE